MVVVITNLTDAPDRRPESFAIYNKLLRPGGTLRVPAQLIDAKIRKLETADKISIGSVPPWYQDYKLRRKARNLDQKGVTENRKAARDLVAKKEAARKRLSSSPSVPQKAAEEPTPVERPQSFMMSEDVEVTDETSFGGEDKGKSRRKKR